MIKSDIKRYLTLIFNLPGIFTHMIQLPVGSIHLPRDVGQSLSLEPCIWSIFAVKITFDLSKSLQRHAKVAYMQIGSISKTA